MQRLTGFTICCGTLKRHPLGNRQKQRLIMESFLKKKHEINAEAGHYNIEGPNAQLSASMSDVAVDKLIIEREDARRRKDWKLSDEIRKHLSEAGIILEDRPGGTTRVTR